MVINSSRFNFADAVADGIKKYLDDYNGEVIKTMTEVIPEVAKEAAATLRKTSPKSGRAKADGEKTYSKGWTYTVNNGRLTTGATVYGKSGTYQRAHLLEHGHAKRGGGRVSAIEHIKPVEEWAVDEVIDRTISRLSAT